MTVDEWRIAMISPYEPEKVSLIVENRRELKLKHLLRQALTILEEYDRDPELMDQIREASRLKWWEKRSGGVVV